MISVTLFQKAGELIGCRIVGHSGYAESGKDIVCAGVSVLTSTCVNALESVCGVVANVTDYDEKNGLVSFELPEEMTEEQRNGSKVLMGALRQGLEDLTGEYSQYVKVTMKERRK